MTDNISRIEVFCEDKHVGAIQRALAAFGVVNVTSQPVTNAKVNGGKVGAASSGNLLDMFVTYVKHNKLKKVDAKTAKHFVVEAGRRATSYGPFLASAQKAGLLRKVKGSGGRKTQYDVVLK